jgi:homoserine trans-succinylase
MTCKFEIHPIKNLMPSNNRYDHIPSNAIETLIINQMSLKTTTANNNKLANTSLQINTKFITVSHKYYFHNETEHIILVRKYMAN